VPGTEIIVFYPKDGVSVVQERQMITQVGSNVHVFGIRGNFDEAQRGVKAVFSDEGFAEELAEKGFRLSSANSINIGRLVPQVAYYVNAYAQMLAQGEIEDGEQINICVPTGNFGNILSAWYAKQMGLPVARLICASNENKILTDFLNTGIYDTRRDFILTSSPSMDILISSNLERLLWHLSDGDSERISGLMTELEKGGVYDAGSETKEALRDFHGGFAEMPVSHAALAKLWHEEKHLIDTHTAVAYAVYLDYKKQTGDDTKTLIASTASPYKFAGSVAAAIGIPSGDDEYETIENLVKATGVPVPKSLWALETMPVTHDTVIEKTEIKSAVESSLK
jgi:threonine synthase